MNLFNPLIKELFEISEQNAPKQQARPKKAPKKQQQAKPVEQKVQPKEKPKDPMPVLKPAPKKRTVAGIPLNSQTVKQGIIMSEILGKPLSKRR